jgi:hypothetical protein
MMGGDWYQKYIGDKNEKEIFELGFTEAKKHLNLSVNPNYYEVSILKVDILFICYSNSFLI